MFSAIEEFVALGQSESFTAAANRLGVSASHISRRINSLEERLGVRLVNRTTRVVRLTDAGFEYFAKCADILSQMEEANASLSAESVGLEGKIKVSAGGDYAERYVSPSLARFAKQHPKLEIEIDFNPKNINLVDEGIDFAVRYGLLSDSSLVARKLTERNLIAAASPDYIEEYGLPSHPSELVAHRCIVSVNSNWQFVENNKTLVIKVPTTMRSNSAASLVASCLTGLGIVYLPETTLRDRINSGELIPILEPFCATSIPTWLVYPSKRFLPRRVRTAIDFLIHELGS
jgi:DNA-binding transcriptional LysR family regulator